MARPSKKSPNNHEPRKRGFFTYCLTAVSVLWKTKNDTVGKSAISSALGNVFSCIAIAVSGAIVLSLFHTDSKDNVSRKTNIKDSLLNIQNINKPKITLNNTVVITPPISRNSPDTMHPTKSVFRHNKIKNQYLKVSSNLKNIGALLESKLNALHIKTNKGRLEVDFSLYPESKFHYRNNKELALLDSGAIVRGQIKGTDCDFYIKDIPIQEIQKTFSGPVLEKINGKMSEIIQRKMVFVCNELKGCLQE